jgi:hypothetical protein
LEYIGAEIAYISSKIKQTHFSIFVKRKRESGGTQK